MIVIPMAGTSRRFTNAGYKIPKYMLPLHGRPLFDWAVLTFSKQFATESFLFVVREENNTLDFVIARARALGINTLEVVVLDSSTGGQAETVEMGLKSGNVGSREPLSIFNIDTFRRGVDLVPPPDTQGWLEVFRSHGDNWSFIELMPGEPDRVRRCVEKVRISDLCCTGLYHFAAADLFFEALAAERCAPSSHELFVAPLYNHLIERGVRIGWREALECDVILSGVPAEYEALVGEPPSRLFDPSEVAREI